MTKRKKKHGIITVLIIILILLLLLALFVRFFSPFDNMFTVSHNGKELTNNQIGIAVSPESKFTIARKNKKKPYEIKIYATGTEETDFVFIVNGEEYSWYRDIANINKGRGEDFTEAFKINRDGDSFTILGSITTVLTDMWDEAEIAFSNSIPLGDRFRMEITLGKETFHFGFNMIENDIKIFLSPETIIF